MFTIETPLCHKNENYKIIIPLNIQLFNTLSQIFKILLTFSLLTVSFMRKMWYNRDREEKRTVKK